MCTVDCPLRLSRRIQTCNSRQHLHTGVQRISAMLEYDFLLPPTSRRIAQFFGSRRVTLFPRRALYLVHNLILIPVIGLTLAQLAKTSLSATSLVPTSICRLLALWGAGSSSRMGISVLGSCFSRRMVRNIILQRLSLLDNFTQQSLANYLYHISNDLCKNIVSFKHRPHLQHCCYVTQLLLRRDKMFTEKQMNSTLTQKQTNIVTTI